MMSSAHKPRSAYGRKQPPRSNSLRASILLALLGSAAALPGHAQTYTRTEVIAYVDDRSGWVLGHVRARTIDAIETERTEFTVRLQPQRIFSFNALQQTLAYHPDGTLATVTDARGNTTSLSGWAFGVPQRIANADGTAQTALVDSVDGWIRELVDEAGSKTCYGYDAMGRISQITYTSEAAAGICDGSAWNATTVRFEPVAHDEYGIPAGHWRRTEETGNARKLTYFDAFWRPIIEEAVDTGDMHNTNSWVAKRYDTGGRVIFQSYPRNPFQAGSITWAAANQGTHTAYDALDRPVRIEQDSEFGVRLLTTIEYLPGFVRRTTNPNGQSTTERFQAFDTPTFDFPTQIDTPESTRTTIARDVFGKPQAMTRSGR